MCYLEFISRNYVNRGQEWKDCFIEEWMPFRNVSFSMIFNEVYNLVENIWTGMIFMWFVKIHQIIIIVTVTVIWLVLQKVNYFYIYVWQAHTIYRISFSLPTQNLHRSSRISRSCAREFLSLSLLLRAAQPQSEQLIL